MESSGQETNIELPFATSHAFIIGINDYEHVSRLSTAVSDAKILAQQLKDAHGYRVHGPLLNASRADVIQWLDQEIPKQVGIEDRILFYFAGHGIALDGEEGPNGYLVAADTKPGIEETLISMNHLHDALTNLPCRHGLLILDCCFSGAFKWSSGFRDVIFDMPKVIYEERFWRYCKDPAWQVITSSAYDQKAVDIIANQSLGLREVSNTIHSPFAMALLKALQGEADIIPAGNGDGVITATELYMYLRDLVETETTENVMRQSPSLFNLQRHDKGEFIFLNPRHRFNLPPTPGRNPFMGLSSFSEADANLFYGRDRVVAALLDKVKQERFIVVSGASGTGKSSVIKAGLLPTLRKKGFGILPIIRPGKEPMQTIDTELRDIEEKIALGPTILVIDQYEELITQCLSPDDRNAFEQQLLDWLDAHPDLHVMLSIRSDFEPQFESEIFGTRWQQGRYVVPAFSLEEIREVISKPAIQAVLFYEPDDLIDQLSEEVSQAPGALPLLSFTLSELYHAYLKSGREDRALTEADYHKLGGVVGALRNRANAIYDEMDVAHQDSMRKLMIRMVSVEGGELASRRVYRDDLIFSDERETSRVQDVAQTLVEARLVSTGRDGQGHTYYEPAHDALVRAWARLWEWIKAMGEGKLGLMYKLSLAVTDHDLNSSSKKAMDYLWNDDPRLDLLYADILNKDHGFNAQEESFVKDSYQLRHRNKRRRWTIVTAVIIGLAGLAIYAFIQQGFAKEQTVVAQTQTRTTESVLASTIAENLPRNQNVPALQLAKFASNNMLEKQSLPITQRELTSRFYGQIYNGIEPGVPLPKIIFKQSIDSKFSPSGKTILTTSKDKSVKLWNLDGDSLMVFKTKAGAIENPTFSPDGQLVLALSKEDSTAILWNIDGTLKSIFQVKGKLESAIFSPGGNRILTRKSEMKYTLWDLDANNIFEFFATKILFSPDSTMLLASWYNSALRSNSSTIWTLQGDSIATFDGHIAAFSSIHKKLYIVDPIGMDRVKLWDLEDLTNIDLIIPKENSEIKVLIVSSDGKLIITLTESFNNQGLNIYNQRLSFWDSSGNLTAEYDFDAKYNLSISPYHVSLSPVDKSILLIEYIVFGSGKSIYYDNNRDSITSMNSYVRFSPDGQMFLTYANSSAATSTGPQAYFDIGYLYNQRGQLLAEFGNENKPLRRLTFSPDSRMILTQLEDEAILYTRNGELVSHLVLNNIKNHFFKSIISPDGENIIVYSEIQSPLMINLESESSIELFKDKAMFKQVEYSPDASKIIGLTTNEIRVLDLKILKEKTIALTNKLDDTYYGFNFSDDGNTLLVHFRRLHRGDHIAFVDLLGNSLIEYKEYSSSSYVVDGKWILSTNNRYYNYTPIENLKSTSREYSIRPELRPFLSPKGNFIIVPTDSHTVVANLVGDTIVGFLGRGSKVSPDESKIITIAVYESNKRNTYSILWNLNTGEKIAILNNNGVGWKLYEQHLNFSPNGKLILAIQSKNRIQYVQLWNLQGDMIAQFVGGRESKPKFISSANFSRNGKWIIIQNKDGNIRVFPTPERINEYLINESPIPDLTKSQKVQYGLR